MKTAIFALSLCSAAAFAQPPQMGQQAMPNLEELFFKQFDADNNGQVSRAEFLKPTEAQFDHMDRDKNGALDQAEVKAFNDEMKERMQQMQQRMQQQGGAPRR